MAHTPCILLACNTRIIKKLLWPDYKTATQFTRQTAAHILQIFTNKHILAVFTNKPGRPMPAVIKMPAVM